MKKTFFMPLSRLLLDWGGRLRDWCTGEQSTQSMYVSSGTASGAREDIRKRLAKMATFYVDDEKFAINFARNARHYFLRITGGCGLMEKEHGVAMDVLISALGGDKAGDPYFDGFGVMGATRMHRLSDPSIIVPGVTEILPAIHRKIKRAAILGIVAMTPDLRYGTDDTGILLEVNEANDFYTIVHPDLRSLLMVKPSEESLPLDVERLLARANANGIVPEYDPNKALWRAEYRQSLKFCSELMKLDDWQSLLLVYNGGGITEEEIRIWATLGKVDPRYQVLLVKGSGRKADQYANDSAWLAEHPTVHVADNQLASIRGKLLQLGAIRHPRR